MRLPIRTRLTLVFALMMLAVLGIAAVALLVGFRAELRRTVDDGLRSRVQAMVGDPSASVESTGGEKVFAQLLDVDGVVASSPNLSDGSLLPAPMIGSLEGETFLDRDVRTVEERIPARLLAVPLADGSVLVVGVDVEDQREAVAGLTVLVAIGGPVVLVAISILGWILARAALRPVEQLRSEAAAISVVEPSRRLRIPETGDELQRLAETLNDMLDRLHEALDRERRFVDEASHELRTPLGVLKAEVDLASREPRSREELEGALRSIAQETERLRRLTQDLLVLARSDRGRLPVHRTDVDVSAVLRRVIGEFADRAAANDVRLGAAGEDVHARVDGDRIRQAVENLVDNALRHTPRGGEIEVRADRDGERLRIVVRDTGSGFPRNLGERAFEPFAREDRDGEGAGLGLAIVRAVAEAHGGSATATNLDGGGAAVSLDIPG